MKELSSEANFSRFEFFGSLFLSGDFARLAALEQTTLTTQPKVPSALTSTKSVLHTSDTSSKSSSLERQQRVKQERFSLPSFFVRSPRQGLPRRTPSTRGAKCASPQTRAGARTTGTPADASSIFGIREQAPGLALELIINLAAQSRSSPRRTCLFCSDPPGELVASVYSMFALFSKR